MNETKQFLARKHLRKALYVGKGLHPEGSGHWSLTVYFTANYNTGRAWVYGNFFCVEEVSLLYLQTFFHITRVEDITEYNDIFTSVEALRRKQDGNKKAG
ncbi:MAG: hypothetical protein ACRC6V_04070 [Bacteroidales bacterium]